MGGKGTSITFQAAVRVGGSREAPRLLYITPAFQQAMPELGDLIARIVAKPHSVWRIVPRDTFADADVRNKRGRRRVQRPLLAIALATSAQASAANLENMFPLPGLLRKFQNIDLATIVTGA